MVELGAEFVHEITTYEELFPNYPWKVHKLVTWAQGDGPAIPLPNQLTLFWLESEQRLVNSVDYSTVIVDDAGEVAKQIPCSPDDELINQIKASAQVLDDADNVDFNTIPGEVTVTDYLQQHLQVENPEVLDLFNAGFSNTYCSNSDALKMRDVVFYTSLYEEDHSAEYRFDKGFSRTLVPYLAKGIQILRNWQVTEVDDTQPDALRIRGRNNQVIRCHRVVCTPTHQLVNEIRFNPPLPTEFAKTIADIKLENAIKVILVFEKRFWPKELHGMICAGCLIPEIWFIERSPTDFVAVGFTTSICADRVQKMGKEKATQGMVDQLNRMFGNGKQPANEYKKRLYYDWSTNPYARGGYMCVLPKAQRDVLFAFKHPRIVFAGESYGRAFSSVGGALESSLRAKNLIKESFSTARL